MFINYKSTVLIALAVSVTAAPILPGAIASAQLFPSQRPSSYPTSPSNVVIPVGTTIPVKYDEAEKILVTPEETAPVTLTVAANVRTRNGTILIPYNSQIVGQIEPSGAGSQFVAQELIIDDNSPQSIDATSGIVTRTETVKRGANTGGILKGAAIGAAAASVLAAVTGDRVDVAEVLGGAGLGALAGWVFGGNQAELISINPNTDLDVTLRSPLTLR